MDCQEFVSEAILAEVVLFDLQGCEWLSSGPTEMACRHAITPSVTGWMMLAIGDAVQKDCHPDLS